jgi:hypothetical protein
LTSFITKICLLIATSSEDSEGNLCGLAQPLTREDYGWAGEDPFPFPFNIFQVLQSGNVTLRKLREILRKKKL